METLKQRIQKLKISDFQKKCYLNLIKVPVGQITTYQSLAGSLDSKAYRAVGSAMAKNPLAPEVPCHRVIKSNGNIGEYAYGVKQKVKMLKNEGIEIKFNQVLNYQEFLYNFNQE